MRSVLTWSRMRKRRRRRRRRRKRRSRRAGPTPRRCRRQPRAFQNDASEEGYICFQTTKWIDGKWVGVAVRERLIPNQPQSAVGERHGQCGGARQYYCCRSTLRSTWCTVGTVNTVALYLYLMLVGPLERYLYLMLVGWHFICTLCWLDRWCGTCTLCWLGGTVFVPYAGWTVGADVHTNSLSNHLGGNSAA